MTLDDMLDEAAGGATTVTPGWRQGRATYGGLVGGLLVARAEALCADPARALRSASFAFVGPVAAGAATLDGVVLRAGSSATQIQVTIVQEGKPCAVLLATFADGRRSDIAVDAAERSPRPALPDVGTTDPLPYVEGLTPEFLAHVDLRFASGPMPFSGASEPDFGGWMRLTDAPARFGLRELVTLADAWPPAVVPLLDRLVPMSTLAWTFEPVAWPAPGEVDAPDAWWQYDVRTVAAGEGFAHTSARLWDGTGRLRALSRQTVIFFG